MNRIDTAQAPYELRRALAEFTGAEVSTLTLGKVKPVEGHEDGKQRQMTAKINGERKNFVAMEIGGKVTIYDGNLGLAPNQVHDFLKRVDAAKEKARLANKASNSVTNNKANGWPTRLTANHTNPVRAMARRR